MGETALRISASLEHWLVAGAFLLAWLWITWLCLRRKPAHGAHKAEVLVVYASQTGHAEDLAKAAHRRVLAAGSSSHLVRADHVKREMLSHARQIVFVLSTTGEGDAPDMARRFDRELLGQPMDLSHAQVCVLALGDRRYSQFCGFGQKVDAWARTSGAHCVHPAVLVDDLNPVDLGQWDTILTRLGYAPLDEAVGDPVANWGIHSRELVAEGAPGETVTPHSTGLYRLTLVPASGQMPAWEIGDLFELRTEDGHLRDYSIANRPGGDEVVLFVRRMVADGQVGRGSGLLTGAEIGQPLLEGRVRPHAPFRPPSGSGPVLAIGAGSGWAGLRPHLLHAHAQEKPCWLVFGERGPDETVPLFAEMRGWLEDGALDRLDIVLSRPATGQGRYVQGALKERRAGIRTFLGDEGCVVICGRLAMGEACRAALIEALGQDWVDKAIDDGRWRQDLY